MTPDVASFEKKQYICNNKQFKMKPLSDQFFYNKGKVIAKLVVNTIVSVLLVTHNMAVAKALADRVGVLKDGVLEEYRGDRFAYSGSRTSE